MSSRLQLYPSCGVFCRGRMWLLCTENAVGMIGAHVIARVEREQQENVVLPVFRRYMQYRWGTVRWHKHAARETVLVLPAYTAAALRVLPPYNRAIARIVSLVMAGAGIRHVPGMSPFAAAFFLLFATAVQHNGGGSAFHARVAVKYARQNQTYGR